MRVSMNVTIIGAGKMGRGIGHWLVAGGHDVTVVDRVPEEAGRLAEELRGAARDGATVDAAGPGAELSGDVVILAVYLPGNLEIAKDLGDSLAGKIVVDISSPVKRDLRWARHRARHLGGRGGGTERTGRREGRQGLQHQLLGDAGRRPGGGESLDVLLAGDEEEAKEKVAQLVRDGGCGPSTWVLWSALGSLRIWGSSG
jgi:8-hydroxy-5-deazaflavin:NADPH oxidoreductase